MQIEALQSCDPASDYLRTYREWSYVYGLNDPCIDELRAAVVVDSDRDTLPIRQRDRLERLARLIRREQESLLERAT